MEHQVPGTSLKGKIVVSEWARAVPCLRTVLSPRETVSCGQVALVDGLADGLAYL